MDFGQLFQALLALVFVLGLMFVTLWFIKFCQQKGLSCRLGGSLSSGSRIKIIEHRRIDSGNSVVLLQCDSDEFLILLGNSVLLLSSRKTKASGHD